MKKMLFSMMLLAVVTSGITFTAQQAMAQTETVTDQMKETPVKPEELPDAVKQTLSGDAYAGWTIAAAYLVQDGTNEYYRIELTKDQETLEVKLDKDGQPAS